LQPKHPRGNTDASELYNVDRVSKSEELGQLPADYSKLPPQPTPVLAKVPELGPPLPGDLGPAIVQSQQPAVANYAPPGQDAATERDALRKEAEAVAGSSVFFRPSNPQRAAAATAAPTQTSSAAAASGLAGFDLQAAGPASMAAPSADPTILSSRSAIARRTRPIRSARNSRAAISTSSRP
jgi:type IV secretion system protein VirB10